MFASPPDLSDTEVTLYENELAVTVVTSLQTWSGRFSADQLRTWGVKFSIPELGDVLQECVADASNDYALKHRFLSPDAVRKCVRASACALLRSILAQ